jgi:PHD/YefM family antitoxin component YafN of YafNO toxin-antitoxin module
MPVSPVLRDAPSQNRVSLGRPKQENGESEGYAMATACMPFIDQNVEHVGTTRLRGLNSAKLRSNKKTLVIQENDTPLAVLLNYEQYLIMQNQLVSLLETIDVLTNEEELSSLKAGMDDLDSNRTKNIAEIRATLKKRK